MQPVPTTPEFTVHQEEAVDSSILIGGFSEYGLAGLTAVDYLIDQLEFEQCGHLRVDGAPSITPFEDGTPRHPIRLFSEPDSEVTVLISELAIPLPAAETFSTTLRSWTGDFGIEEIALLSGIPISHAPEDHRTFYVATTDYRDARLGDSALPAMGNGYLDGVKASMLAAGIDSHLKVCAYLTPTHPQAPDADAALRLVETVNDVYSLGVDTEPLKQFAAKVEGHYRELAERLEEQDDEFLPEDRMYM